MRRTVLMADGDAALCGRFRGAMAALGYEAETASDALDCLAKVRRAKPAVLVLDLGLLWGGAEGVLAWLREEGARPAVVLTGEAPPRAVPDRLLNGPGVVAYFRKPVELPDLLGLFRPRLVADRRSARAAAGDRTGSPECPGDGRTGVLVVDDDGMVRVLVRLGLERAGFDVYLASSGREAIELYRRRGQAIALVLLDVRMPGLDGPATLTALRELHPEVRACFMSGDTGDYGPEELLRRGAACVIPKPFRVDRLAETVRAAARDVPAGPSRTGHGQTEWPIDLFKE